MAFCLVCLPTAAAEKRVGFFLNQPDAWFQSAEAGRVTENVLSWQAHEGGWPKNTDTTKPFTGDRVKLQGTFDNGATTDELRFLARRFAVTQDTNGAAAFARGLRHILKAQYTNGGWPQYAPPPSNKYHRHITFNDNSMVRLLEFLREAAADTRYEFVSREQRVEARLAFARGIDCILKCQIKVNGRLTAWCAQHDEIDFSPRPARSYELASLSGSESVGLTRLLMSLPNPRPEVVRSIEAAVAWLQSAKISSIKVVDAKDENGEKDRLVEKDTTAPPMWARFYEIETGRPIFSGRDGVKKYSLAEIERERRTGYSWLSYYPQTLLEKEYPEWRRRNTKDKTPP